MAQSRSFPFRQIIASLASVSMLMAPLPRAQSLGGLVNNAGNNGGNARSDDPYGISSQGTLGPAGMGGLDRQDARRVDGLMGPPQIRQFSGDDRQGPSARSGNPQILTAAQQLQPSLLTLG